MARETRTRLNAELAAQFSETAGRAVTPGRSSLTEGLVEKQDETVELDQEQAQGEAPAVEAEGPERESRRSIFELPRKETVKAPVLPPDASDDAPQR